MVYTKSFVQLLWGVTKRLYLFLPAILADPFDVAARLGMNWDIPNWVGWLLLGIACFVAVFLTYHELWMKADKEEWVGRRSLLIHQRTPHLSKVMGVLDEKRMYLFGLADGVALPAVDKSLMDKLEDYLKVVMRQVASNPRSMDKKQAMAALGKMHSLSQAMNSHGIGIRQLKPVDDDRWDTIANTLSSLTAEVPDAILKKQIRDCSNQLEDMANHIIYQRMRAGLESGIRSGDFNPSRIQAEGAKESMQFLADISMASVGNRLEALLVGDEARAL